MVWSSTKMAKLLTLMVLFFSFTHSSRTRIGVDEDKAWVSKDFESDEKGVEASGAAMENSAREVPTGPDPLHHNIVKPSRP